MRVERSFAFVDLCGFTRFTDLHGDEEAVGVLTRFRTAVREIASDHAVVTHDHARLSVSERRLTANHSLLRKRYKEDLVYLSDD